MTYILSNYTGINMYSSISTVEEDKTLGNEWICV